MKSQSVNRFGLVALAMLLATGVQASQKVEYSVWEACKPHISFEQGFEFKKECLEAISGNFITFAQIESVSKIDLKDE